MSHTPTSSPLPTRCPDRRRAFTLAELVAVMLITIILAGVATASLSPTLTTRHAIAARQVLRDVSFARERAVATGTMSWIVFDAGTETYSLLAENPASPGRGGAAALSDPATGGSFVQQFGTGEFAGVAIVSVNFDGGSEIGFDWIGRPFTSTGTALVSQGVVTMTGGRIITIEPGTGLARVGP